MCASCSLCIIHVSHLINTSTRVLEEPLSVYNQTFSSSNRLQSQKCLQVAEGLCSVSCTQAWGISQIIIYTMRQLKSPCLSTDGCSYRSETRDLKICIIGDKSLTQIT